LMMGRFTASRFMLLVVLLVFVMAGLGSWSVSSYNFRRITPDSGLTAVNCYSTVCEVVVFYVSLFCSFDN